MNFFIAAERGSEGETGSQKIYSCLIPKSSSQLYLFFISSFFDERSVRREEILGSCLSGFLVEV